MTTPTTPEGRRELKALKEAAIGAQGRWSERPLSEATLYEFDIPATVISLLAALEEAEGRLDEHALFDAETDLAFKDLDAQIATLTARAEASEQREAGLREALRRVKEISNPTVRIERPRLHLDRAWEIADAALTTKSGEA